MLEYFMVNTLSLVVAIAISMIFGIVISTRKWFMKLIWKYIYDMTETEEYYEFVKEVTVKNLKISENLVKDISLEFDTVA